MSSFLDAIDTAENKVQSSWFVRKRRSNDSKRRMNLAWVPLDPKSHPRNAQIPLTHKSQGSRPYAAQPSRQRMADWHHLHKGVRNGARRPNAAHQRPFCPPSSSDLALVTAMEQQGFFFHECGRHVGGVPRSSLKGRETQHDEGKRTQATPNQTKTPNKNQTKNKNTTKGQRPFLPYPKSVFSVPG